MMDWTRIDHTDADGGGGTAEPGDDTAGDVAFKGSEDFEEHDELG
jgi:hypothetical protein